MRWKLEKARLKFALIPHKCIECNNMVWLEKYIKYTTYYGDVRIYCKECCVHWFPDMRKEQE